MRISEGHLRNGKRSRTALSADLALAEDLLCAGFSALMLLLLSHWSDSWWLCLPAVSLYLFRLFEVDLRRSVRLGVVLASAYVFVAHTDNLLAAPCLLLSQLLCLNLVFASFGLAVNYARSVFGRNLPLIFLLWFPLEYVLRRLDILGILANLEVVDTGVTMRVIALIQGLAIILAFVLLNPILLLIATCIAERVLGRIGLLQIEREGQSPASIAVPVRRWYSFPDVRSPPKFGNGYSDGP